MGSALAPAVEAVFNAMMEVAPHVGAAQEATVAGKDLAKATEAYEVIATSLDKAVEEAIRVSPETDVPGAKIPGEAASPGAPAPTEETSIPTPLAAAQTFDVNAFLSAPEIKRSLATITTSSAPITKKTSRVSSASMKAQETFASMLIFEVPAPDAAPVTSGVDANSAKENNPEASTAIATTPTKAAAATPSVVLVPVLIRTEPAEAEIWIDGLRMGVGSASVLRPKGSHLTVTARLKGYEDTTLSVVADETKSSAVLISLRAVSMSSEAATPTALRKSTPASSESQNPMASSSTAAPIAPEAGTAAAQDSRRLAPQAEAAAKTPTDLLPVLIRTDPANAELWIDGQLIDTAAPPLRPRGSHLHVVAKLDGYEDVSLDLTVDETIGRGKAISLKPVAPPPLPKPAPAKFQIEATPSDALVSISGQPAMQGTLSGIFPSEQPIHYSVSLEGYKTATGDLAPKHGQTSTASIKLAALQVFARYSAGSAKAVGTAVAAADAAYFLDASGNLFKVGTKGFLWKTATGNSLADNARPVLGKNVAYVCGDKNLCLVSLSTGSIIATKDLDTGDSGLFGRRPIVAGDVIYLSASDGLRVLDATTGAAKKSIPVAGSDMSLAATDGKLVFVDRTGHLIEFDASSGTTNLSIATKAVQPVALETTIANGKAYFADRKGLVCAVDLSAGTLIWAKPAFASAKGVFDDLLLAGGAIWCYTKGSVAALSATNGNLVAPTITGVAAPPFLAEGLVWVPMQDGNLVAHDPSNSRVLKSLKADGLFSARPVEVNGLFICPMADGEVEVLNPLAAK
ncbi:MAG: PQQ-binding-like beta-propeller repeat protein [Treponema sp.]|nr:PQQ-binding-like beta-propeller repeat protein [Treponema sp.]